MVGFYVRARIRFTLLRIRSPEDKNRFRMWCVQMNLVKRHEKEVPEFRKRAVGRWTCHPLATSPFWQKIVPLIFIWLCRRMALNRGLVLILPIGRWAFGQSWKKPPGGYNNLFGFFLLPLLFFLSAHKDVFSQVLCPLESNPTGACRLVPWTD